MARGGHRQAGSGGGPRSRNLEAALDDFFVTMVADGTSDPATLSHMIDRLRTGCGGVVGSRCVTGRGYEGFPLSRRARSVGANLILRCYCAVPHVRDYTIFYCGYRAELLQEAPA